MTIGERIDAVAPIITIRLYSDGMFISTHRGIYHGYKYTPVNIGRDENGVARDVALFADVDAQTPKLVT